MKKNNVHTIIHKMNEFGLKREPFLFIIDFDCKEPVLIPLSSAASAGILYNFNQKSNIPSHGNKKYPDLVLEKMPVSYNEYKKAFQIVQKNLNYGNSYLVNLTFQTTINTNYSLKDIFTCSKAKYKLLFKDQFVVFSPEIFVQINEKGIISSFPMKGTIDASIPDAEKKILNDKKEFAEHCTIVDLIRNDLSMVAKNVYVKKFRYIDKIKTHEKELLQVSSCICGELESDYAKRIGDIIFSLLPAGSISGAPKKKTLEIIREAENYKRGYYTGVMGIFDGIKMDSGVIIRYIEKTHNEMFYKSGGGITVFSKPEKEYKELIDKVYVPII
ncbi:MAG TPA: aminodeoxychorismate synthase component I [Bacteroidales bacterium]|nr:aminodeoxychorismate synthase component I [Bacteroidales bacterium]HQI45249.1 aminodeoxychorismate synthase component I [Bacteroidales bacterium]